VEVLVRRRAGAAQLESLAGDEVNRSLCRRSLAWACLAFALGAGNSGCATQRSATEPARDEAVGQLPLPETNCFPTPDEADAIEPYVSRGDRLESVDRYGSGLLAVRIRSGTTLRVVWIKKTERGWTAVEPPAKM
jgi:hypothetical protein